jgi:hypothetical protein
MRACDHESFEIRVDAHIRESEVQQAVEPLGWTLVCSDQIDVMSYFAYALRNWLQAQVVRSWCSSLMSGDSRAAVSRAVTEYSIRLVEAKASALVSIMARRAGAESARRGTA